MNRRSMQEWQELRHSQQLKRDKEKQESEDELKEILNRMGKWTDQEYSPDSSDWLTPKDFSNIIRCVKILDSNENRKQFYPFWNQQLANVERTYKVLDLKKNVAGFVNATHNQFPDPRSLPKSVQASKFLFEDNEDLGKEHKKNFKLGKKAQLIANGQNKPTGKSLNSFGSILPARLIAQLHPNPETFWKGMSTDHKCVTEYLFATAIDNERRIFFEHYKWLFDFGYFVNELENPDFDTIMKDVKSLIFWETSFMTSEDHLKKKNAEAARKRRKKKKNRK